MQDHVGKEDIDSTVVKNMDVVGVTDCGQFVTDKG